MKTLVVYDSKTGVVEGFSQKFKEIWPEVEIVRLGAGGSVELCLDDYDRVLIGGSIHAGHLQKSIAKFCESNIESLKTKQLGLFLCTLTPIEEASHYFEEAFPDVLVGRAGALGLFGGAVYYSRLNFLEKIIMKQITGRKEDFEVFNEANFQHFVKELSA